MSRSAYAVASAESATSYATGGGLLMQHNNRCTTSDDDPNMPADFLTKWLPAVKARAWYEYDDLNMISQANFYHDYD